MYTVGIPGATQVARKRHAVYGGAASTSDWYLLVATPRVREVGRELSPCSASSVHSASPSRTLTDGFNNGTPQIVRQQKATESNAMAANTEPTIRPVRGPVDPEVEELEAAVGAGDGAGDLTE